jgi:hypothetical protein
MDFEQFSVRLITLNACGGASIQAGTTTPFSTTDASCFGSAISWPDTIAAGTCEQFVLVLAGQLASGSVLVGVEAEGICRTTLISGPICP